jgi:hypothetical protein
MARLLGLGPPGKPAHKPSAPAGEDRSAASPKTHGRARRLAEKGVRRADFFFGRGARIDIQLSNWRRFNSCCSAATGTLDLGWTGEGFCLRAEDCSAREARLCWADSWRATTFSHVLIMPGLALTRLHRLVVCLFPQTTCLPVLAPPRGQCLPRNLQIPARRAAQRPAQ